MTVSITPTELPVTITVDSTVGLVQILGTGEVRTGSGMCGPEAYRGGYTDSDGVRFRLSGRSTMLPGATYMDYYFTAYAEVPLVSKITKDTSSQDLKEAAGIPGLIIDGPDPLDPTVSIAKATREVPSAAAATPESALQPVRAVSTGLTVGPSPVKSGDALTFFWSGKPVTGGVIDVYDAVGTRVERVAVGGSSSRELATVRARLARGTYLAKGVLRTKGGKRERVSLVFAVAK